MKNTYKHKVGILAAFCFLSLLSFNGFGQVGIGTTTPDSNAKLDITSTVAEPGGLLLPRVELVRTTDSAPLTGAVTAGMAVYNTATANDVTPGYYYNDGTVWVRLAGSTSTNTNWELTGNTGTTAGTNFIGTRDNVHFESFTNNTGRMRVQNNGQITMGFGALLANPNQQVNVLSTYSNGVAMGGYSSGSGSGFYGQNIASGNGVYGLNDGSGSGVYGRSQGTGAGVKGENWFGLGWSVHGVDGPVFSNNLLFGADAFFGLTDDLVSNALWGVNVNSVGVAVLGGSNDLSVYPQNGVGVSGSGTNLGVYGYAGAGNANFFNRGNSAGSFSLDTDSNPETNGNNNGTRASARLAGFDNISPDGTLEEENSYFGGYFSGGNENNGIRSYAYAGLKYNANGNGINGTNYKIIGNGTNSTLINDVQGNPRIMFSPEAPEILFQDFGVGRLVNGQARIKVDPILKHSLHVDKNHPLKVFVTLEGDCNGVYVTDKSIDGFTVKELQNGKSDVSFSWQIVANRADDKDTNGHISSKHVGLRLPIGPSPIETTKAGIKYPNKVYNLKKAKKGSSLTTDSAETLSEEELKKTSQNVYKEKKSQVKKPLTTQLDGKEPGGRPLPQEQKQQAQETKQIINTKIKN